MYKSWVPSKKKNRKQIPQVQNWVLIFLIFWPSLFCSLFPTPPSTGRVPRSVPGNSVPLPAPPCVRRGSGHVARRVDTTEALWIRLSPWRCTGKDRLTHGGKVNQGIYLWTTSVIQNRCFKRRVVNVIWWFYKKYCFSLQISYNRQFEARKVVAEDQDATIQIKTNGMSTDQCMDDMWYPGKVRYIPPLIVWSVRSRRLRCLSKKSIKILSLPESLMIQCISPSLFASS